MEEPDEMFPAGLDSDRRTRGTRTTMTPARAQPDGGPGPGPCRSFPRVLLQSRCGLGELVERGIHADECESRPIT